MNKKITVLNDEVMESVVGGNETLVYAGLGVAAAEVVGSIVTGFVGLGYHVAATKALNKAMETSNKDDMADANQYNKIYNYLKIGAASAAGAGVLVGGGMIIGGALASGNQN